MPTLAYRFAHKRLLAFEEVVDQWQIDHAQAQYACDVEDLVAETDSFLETLKRMADRFRDGISPGSTRDDIVAANRTGLLLTKVQGLFRTVRGMIEEVRRLGYIVDEEGRFETAERELAKIIAGVTRSWLLPEKAVVKAAMEDLAARRCRVL